jgi:hypothetical protein
MIGGYRSRTVKESTRDYIYRTPHYSYLELVRNIRSRSEFTTNVSRKFKPRYVTILWRIRPGHEVIEINFDRIYGQISRIFNHHHIEINFDRIFWDDMVIGFTSGPSCHIRLTLTEGQ